MERKPLISVVLSFLNEEEVLSELIRRLSGVLTHLPIEYELIFVNDASTDHSLSLLIEKAAEDRRIKIINMSRRFGVPECISAGIRYAKGDAVIIMDSDLQDPPEVLPQLIEKWLGGADVVYTVRASREGESLFRTLLVKWAFVFIRLLSNVDLVIEAGDFKLVSRRVVNELVKLNEKAPYLRGLVGWVGFKQVPVFYHRHRRFAGKSHQPIFCPPYSRGPIDAFISAVTSFSTFPLTIFLLIGLTICVGSLAFLIALFVARYLEIALPEYSGIMIAVFFLIGIQLLGIGTVGLYLGRVYEEVKNRPNYIVESTIGFE